MSFLWLEARTPLAEVAHVTFLARTKRGISCRRITFPVNAAVNRSTGAGLNGPGRLSRIIYETHSRDRTSLLVFCKMQEYFWRIFEEHCPLGVSADFLKH
jgi:hypothetical protein